MESRVKSSGLDHSALKRMVDFAADEMEEARAQSEQARDYYDSHQLTADEKKILKRRKQPELIINRIKRKIDALVGIEQKGRVDPRALPRNPQDEDAADVATKVLVFVDDITRFDAKRSAFCYNLAIEGYGGVEVRVNDRGDPELIRLRWEEIFFDPYSRELDFSDAGYTGVQKWMALDEALAFCRAFGSVDDDALSEMLERSMGSTGSSYDDRPKSVATNAWGDNRKQRVKLAYMYYRRDGEWRLALLCGGGVIYDEVSPFRDYSDDPQGVPSNAMILQACYIDRENRRYGLVLDMIPMQDEVNKRRSKLLHQLNSRQTMGQRGAVADVTKMKRELAQPDGHVEYDQDPASSVPSLQIVPQDDQIAGQFSLLQESKSEIDMFGPNASLLGQLEGQQSGRAILAQQQAGMAELAPFYDNLRDWTLRVYRAMWSRVRQFWQEPRYVRVTDEQERLQFIGVNGAPGPDGMPGQMLAQMDVDIIIDMTPEYASLQMEEFNSLVELAKSGAVPIPPDVLVEASQLRNKAKLLEKMRGDPQREQQAAMAQKQAMALQMAQLQATVQKLSAEAENKQADTAKKIAETQQIQQETALEPAKMQVEMAAGAEQRDMDRARFGEEVRSGRVAEGREGQRMAEEFRSGRANEEMARERQATDIEIARREAANPAARG